MNSKFKIVLKYFFAAIVTVIIFYFLFKAVDINEVTSFVAKSDIKYIIMAFIVYNFSIVFRVLRFRYLIGKNEKNEFKIPFFELHRISILHNFFTSVLPSATGELSYIYMINKTGKVKMTDNVASLLIARIFDFISFGIVMLLGYLYLQEQLPLKIKYIFFAALLVILFITKILILLVTPNANITVLKVVKYVVSFFKLNKIKQLNVFVQKFESITKLESKLNIQTIVLCMVISFLMWACATLSNYFIFLATGVGFSIIKILFAIALLKFMSLLPIQGIAGFGTSEGLWAIVFVQLGLSMENAILTGFAAHIISLLFVVILAGYVLFYGLIESSRKKQYPKYLSNARRPNSQ